MGSVSVQAAARRLGGLVVGLESAIAPLCAAALLVHPTPFTWPALMLGVSPSAVRLATTGRLWRATPFDLGLALFVLSVVTGFLATLDPSGSTIRLTGLAAALILFAWAREHAGSPRAAYAATVSVLALVGFGTVLLVHVAAPFLRLDRVPPLAVLASLLEPLGLYRVFAADAAALQRFRLYASGVGALAAVGLSMTAGLGLASSGVRQRATLAVVGVFFVALLYASDNRGSMIAAALTLGCLVVWWRPRLLTVAALVVFGTLDLIALGLVQRGLSLRTVVERLEFWRNGLLLAAETPFSGVGLGVESVQLVYRAVFQPAYPPFNHAHNVFVQALLEQGVLGLVGLVVMCVALLRLGAAPPNRDDPRSRAASLAALGGTLALVTAGLTEIVALTTVGSALLFGLFGLLVASHDAALTTVSALTEREVATPARPASRLAQAAASATRVMYGMGDRLRSRLARLTGGARAGASIAACAIVILALSLAGLARPLAALPFLNAGTTSLYRATLADDLSPADQALAWAGPALLLAISVDPGNAAALRNLSLASAAGGNRVAAHQLADEARAMTAADDIDGQFGVGRAYAEAGALDDAIEIWAEIGAGPQLLRLGRLLTSGPNWETGVAALVSAAQVGAPARPAADAITRAAQAHGESADRAVERLAPLVADGGLTEYFARLQIARVYRLDNRLGPAEQALTQAYAIERDEQFELERGLQLVWRERYADAEQALRWVIDHPADPPRPVPDGDDPLYWLAIVQLRLGRPAEAASTARAGLAALPPEQGSLRVPYHLLLGESLLAAGKPAEALAALRAGQRLAPSDPRLADAITRARAAQR